MKKLSAYQKLKQENERLRKDLTTISTEPNSFNGLCIKAEWVMLSKLEETLWLGENKMPQVLDGILKQVSDKNY